MGSSRNEYWVSSVSRCHTRGPMPMENSLTRTPQSFAAAKWPNSWTAISTPKIKIAARTYRMVMEQLPLENSYARPVPHRPPGGPVRRQDVLQGRVRRHGHGAAGRLHQPGNVGKADPLRQEEAHRLLVGAVKDGAGGAALGGGLLRQAEAGE